MNNTELKRMTDQIIHLERQLGEKEAECLRVSDTPRVSRKSILGRSKGLCEAQLNGCWKKAAEIPHHIKYKSRGGSDSEKNLMNVCVPCHRAIHDHKEGTEGFRSHRWNDEGVSELSRPVMLKDYNGKEVHYD